MHAPEAEAAPETETETETGSEGHQHDESCYEERTERVLVCELEESEGHHHDASCEETTRTLTCGESESEGHQHSASCEETTRTLTCGESESEGHTHGSGCYETTETLVCSDDSEDHEHDSSCYETSETLVCSESESSGHTHSDSCYTEETTYTCGESESEGHHHDDSCYETETSYTCGEEESEGHTHDDSCYEERTVRELICGQEEGGSEAQPAEEGSEPRYEEVRVLVCGKEEHTHEDACYQQETNEVRYFCSLDEHTHTDSCYFESGDLRCTIPEHTHTDECLVRPTQLPEIADEFVCGIEEHAHTDECYTLDEATGELVLTCEKTEHVHTDECLTQAQPEIDPEAVELNETFTAESEDGAVILTLQVNGLVHLAETEEPEAAGETDVIDETDMTDETDTIDEPQETGFRLVLTESEDWGAYDEYTELASEEGEVLVMGVLDYTLTYNGQSVDLSECEITVEVEPTEAFQEYMDAPESMGLMTMAMTDEAGQGEVAEEDMAEAMEVRFTSFTQQPGRVAYSLIQGANPSFTVQYYAYLDRVTTAAGTAGTPLNVINTDNGGTGKGGKLPYNGTGDKWDNLVNLYLDSNGRLATKTELTKIYRDEGFEYFQAPGLLYFNIVINNTASNYDTFSIWVLKEGRDPASVNEADWEIHSYDPQTTRFTNRPETVQPGNGYILIQDNSVIRLVYKPAEETEVQYDARFYDYDISDGYTSATEMTTTANGINTRISGSGTQLSFGNGNAGVHSDLAAAHWTDKRGVSNMPNQMNRTGGWGTATVGYAGCTYGMVTGFDPNTEDVILAGGLKSNPLFGKSNSKGKTIDSDITKIAFHRVGDTYTLSHVPGTQVKDLDVFHSYKGQWTNLFWPMDEAATAGAKDHDLKFGGNVVKKGYGLWYGAMAANKLPDSNDGVEHNSYFGMQTGISFEVTKNYVGPLEYYFFGDDDMWVFLVDKTTGEQKLICDIGGVHNAVGQYVNLWDYIDKNALENLGKDENGKDKTAKYELRFFYTERGASGSTCWMQFTLPTVVGLDLDEYLENKVTESTGALRIQKELNGVENTEDFTFKLSLVDKDGKTKLPDNYLVRTANGELLEDEAVEGSIAHGGVFTLKGGDVLVVYNLPEGTKYTVEEINNTGYSTTIERTDKDTAETISGTVTSGTISANFTSKVVYTNSSSYELPATGGSGTTLWYTMGALILLGAVFLMYKNGTKKEDGVCQ